MKNDVLKQMEEFLNKETPTYGGCMVCRAIGEDNRQQLLLIERHKFANGDGFTINMRMFYDYDFLWEERKEDWKVLWKYDGGE